MASELTVANIIAERGVGDPPTVQMLNNHDADSLGGEPAGKLQFLSKPAGSAVATAEIVGTAIDATGVTGKLDFYTATGGTSTKRLTIDSAGLATFSNGINLGNTASATATTLDGYEEGTWTPALTGTTETIPSGYNVGKYVRIGSLVWINWYSGAMTLASSSSSAIITGLPFACIDAEASYSVFSYVFGNAVDGNSRGGYVNKNATTMTFADDNAADSSTFIDGSSKYLMVTAVYQTDEAF